MKKEVKALPRRGGEFLISMYDDDDEEESELLEPRRLRPGFVVYTRSAARDALGSVGFV